MHINADRHEKAQADKNQMVHLFQTKIKLIKTVDKRVHHLYQ